MELVYYDCAAPEADDARQQVLRLLAVASGGDSGVAAAEIGNVLDELVEDPERLLLRVAHLTRAFTFAGWALAKNLAAVYGAEYAVALNRLDEAFSAEKARRLAEADDGPQRA